MKNKRYDRSIRKIGIKVDAPHNINKSFSFSNMGFNESTYSYPKRHRRVESDTMSKVMDQSNTLFAVYSCEVSPYNGKSFNSQEFLLKYKKDIDNRFKCFTLSLAEIISSNEGIKQLGKERTYELNQFDSTKIYNETIELK